MAILFKSSFIPRDSFSASILALALAFFLLGGKTKGVELHEEKLKNHLDFFPVVVEYTDLLLQQGEYRKALLYTEYCCALHERREIYAPDEYMVLKSMKAYATIFAIGNFNPAVEALKGMSEFLKREEAESLKATKIHMVELYLQISVFIDQHTRTDSVPNLRDFGKIKFRDDQWSFLPMSLKCCADFGTWYHSLRQQGFYWESFRFLRLVIDILMTSDSPAQRLGAVLQKNSRGTYLLPSALTSKDLGLEDAFLTLGQITSYGDEQLILAELASTSSMGLMIMETSSPHYLHAAKLCWHRERSLVAVIVDRYPHLSTSRPFLEWFLKEHVRTIPFQCQLTAQLRGDVPSLITQKRWSIKPLLDELLEVGGMQKPQGKDRIQSIQKVLKCSEQSGDTLLQRTALQELIMFTGSTVSSRLQSLATLANLLDTVDLVGYIDYLVIKYTVLQDIAPDISSDMQAAEKSILCEEIRRFNLRYPWDIAFSLPLSEYIKDKIYMRVLTDLHREAEYFSTKRILKGLKKQLPNHLEPSRFRSSPVIINVGPSESDMEEEAGTCWTRRYRPKTAEDRVTTLSHGPTVIAARGIDTEERPDRAITISPTAQKSDADQEGGGDKADQTKYLKLFN